MKRREKEALRQYLRDNRVTTLQDLQNFYVEYSKYAVHSIKDYLASYEGYYNFLMRNIGLLASNKEEMDIMKGRIEGATGFIKSDIVDLYDDKIVHYVDFLNCILGKNQEGILDVGPGNVPVSSMLLAKDHKGVGAIDVKFYLSTESLGYMGIDAKEKLFDENTDISKFQVVTGRHPCSAILHMVRLASGQNKPYIIKLCDCDKPTLYDILSKNLPDMDKIDVSPLLRKVTCSESGRVNTYYEWSDILPLYDSHAKVVDGYATNVDITPGKLKDIIDRTTHTSDWFEVFQSVIGIPAEERKTDFVDMHNDNTSIDRGRVTFRVEGSLDTRSLIREINDKGSLYWHFEREDESM